MKEGTEGKQALEGAEKRGKGKGRIGISGTDISVVSRKTLIVA